MLWLHGTRAYRGDTASVSDNCDRAASLDAIHAGRLAVPRVLAWFDRLG